MRVICYDFKENSVEHLERIIRQLNEAERREAASQVKKLLASPEELKPYPRFTQELHDIQYVLARYL